MREAVAEDINIGIGDEPRWPKSLGEIKVRHTNMQSDHDRRQKMALPMLAWGPFQGYQAHLDRLWLLREVDRLNLELNGGPIGAAQPLNK